MWTVKAVAARDSISKQAVSKSVRKLAANQGLIVERDERDRIIRLNVVQYDQLRGHFADPSKAQAPKARTAEQRIPVGDTYEDVRLRQSLLDEERSRLALAETKSNLVRVDGVIEALDQVGGEIATVHDRLPNLADDLTAVAVREGSSGMRQELIKLAARLRSEIAHVLRAAKPSGAPNEKEGELNNPVPS